MRGLYSRVELCIRTWQQHSNTARLRAERRRIHKQLRKHFDNLVETKSHALKATGVFGTEHEHLETAIVSLAYALDDYRDGM